MFFYQDAAPSQWTLDAGPADSLLAVKGGAQDYNDTGGQVLGSWTPTDHTHVAAAHTHSTPEHNHLWVFHNASRQLSWLQDGDTAVILDGSGSMEFGLQYYNEFETPVRDIFKGDYYTKNADADVTGSDGDDATTASASPSTDRPSAAVGLIATKD
jgi:hypothetical protein